uniref:C-type lectine n=1 Tax=Scylla paramamosain TaxID=85552 RepID=A0A0S4XQM5_SCYPA|nr:C-type lectine [Scylla paramamosain]
MVTSRGCMQLAHALVLVLAMLSPAEGGCRRGSEIECRSGGQCISRDNICNNGRDCSDGSDEDIRLCKLWPPRSDHCRHYPASPFYYAGGRRTAYYLCQNSGRSSDIDSRICKIILQAKLDMEEQDGMNMSSEVISLLNSAVNSTLNHRMPDCPMLYIRVGNDCLSFFSPAKVSWAEARQFCLSIYGDLWHAKDFESYGRLMEYMREAQLTSNYWIGGRYDIDTNAWSWTTDDSAMPLGAPFWSIKYESSCVPRGPPHTDPYSAPPAALPEARCYQAVLSPKQRSPGWCSAMTYEHFYYWSDEMCDEAFSPLCIFTGPTAAPSETEAN